MKIEIWKKYDCDIDWTMLTVDCKKIYTWLFWGKTIIWTVEKNIYDREYSKILYSIQKVVKVPEHKILLERE